MATDDSACLVDVGSDGRRGTRSRLILLALPILAAAVYLATSTGYGYFRDELYYLACSHHLAWGYVDQPPLSILLLFLSRHLFGTSRLALHVLPALAGGATVLLTALIAQFLGGKSSAQALAMVSVMVAPLYLVIDTFYSMNSFDIFFWTLAAYLMVRILEGHEARWWPLLGLVLGLGLMNKISVLWLGFGLAVGLLATRQRRWLATRGPWIAAGVAMMIFLPYILWQIRWGWPTLEFIHNATTFKMASVSPLAFLGEQIRDLQPLTLPVWLTGLVWSLAMRSGRRLRPLGIAWLSVLATLLVSGKSRASYLGPAYPMLFAMGAVAISQWLEHHEWRWAPAISLSILALGGLVTAPLALPVLPVETHIRYAAALGLAPHSEERTAVGRLPQVFADRFGWPNLVGKVAEVYDGLPARERSRTAIFTENYGEAGAIDLLGRARGLPGAVSGHNNYWIWGPPKKRISTVIVVSNASDLPKLRKLFDQVVVEGALGCKYCMPYEARSVVYLCRGPHQTLAQLWPGLKHYI